MRRALLCLAAFAACSSPGPPADFVLKIGVVAPIGELSPSTHVGAATLAGDLVFEPLVRPEPGGAPSRFVRAIERIGSRRWRLALNEGVRFSDGSPVSAGDVAEALRRQGLTVAEAGPWTLEAEPAGGGLSLDMALHWAVVARRAGERWLGTGAFAVASQDERRLVLRRVEPRPGRISVVELVAYASAREVFARLLRGEVNAMNALDRTQVELLDGVPGIRVVRGSAPNAVAVVLNPRRLSAEERRAVAASLPFEELAAAMRGEAAEAPAGGPRPTLPGGRPLSIGYARYFPQVARAALALRRSLGLRGGDVTGLEVKEYQAREAEFDLAISALLVWPPGALALTFGTGAAWNRLGYSNPAFDAAAASGDDAAAGEALRLDPPVLIVARRERIAALDARLREARLGEWGVLDPLPEWEVSP